MIRSPGGVAGPDPAEKKLKNMCFGVWFFLTMVAGSSKNFKKGKMLSRKA